MSAGRSLHASGSLRIVWNVRTAGGRYMRQRDGGKFGGQPYPPVRYVGACQEEFVGLKRPDGRKKIFLVNPLLFVFSSIEAAELWNRPSGDVRSAAAGSGHRAARMQAYECGMRERYGWLHAGPWNGFTEDLTEKKWRV